MTPNRNATIFSKKYIWTVCRITKMDKFAGLPWIWISMDKSMDISTDISMCGYQT